MGAGLDWKTSLQELCSQQTLGTPEYRVEDDGPEHAKTFFAEVLVGGEVARQGHRAGPRRTPSSRRRPRRGRRSGPRRRMPELPEVEVVRRGLEAHVVGREIADVELYSARVTRRHLPGPWTSAARLAGQQRRWTPDGEASTSGSSCPTSAPSSSTSG